MAEPSRCDTVVVGAGIAGLTAGAMLAKAGMDVLVVEAADHPGGCVRAFSRGGYDWDPAVHLVLDPPHWRRLLDHLGVGDEVRFLEAPYLYRAVAGDLAISAPFGREQYIEAHAELCGAAADEVRGFLTLCADTHRTLHDMIFRRGGLSALARLMEERPDVMRYRMATAAEVMDVLLTDPEARALISVPGLYLGLPPSKLAFSAFSQLLFAHAADGAAYVEGGAQAVVNALCNALRRGGGRLLTGRSVDRVLLDEGRAAGVALAGGEQIEAAAVISTTDPYETFDRLLCGHELPAGYRRKLRRLSPSHSFFNTFAATSLDPLSAEHGSHLTLFSAHRDIELAWRESFEGRPGYGCVAAPTVAEGTRSGAAGHHQIVSTTAAPYERDRPWPQGAARLRRGGDGDPRAGAAGHPGSPALPRDLDAADGGALHARPPRRAVRLGQRDRRGRLEGARPRDARGGTLPRRRVDRSGERLRALGGHRPHRRPARPRTRRDRGRDAEVSGRR